MKRGWASSALLAAGCARLDAEELLHAGAKIAYDSMKAANQQRSR